MLTKKWSLLKRLEYSVRESTEIIEVAAKLHNFCLDHGQELDDVVRCNKESNLDSEVKKARDNWYNEINAAISTYSQGQETSLKRKRSMLVDIVRDLGYTRPTIRRVELPFELGLQF